MAHAFSRRRWWNARTIAGPGTSRTNSITKIFESRGWEVLPAYIGLGFTLRGERMGHALFGTLTSPETFGNHGAGTTLFWVDPKLDMTFVGLSTGVMNSDVNIERWQRLSDIAVSAAM